jgi:head-tail adaptor
MSYTAGFLNKYIMPLNRKAAQGSKYGIDGEGIEWEPACVKPLHANVDWVKGKAAMNAGALDAYAVKIVRMRWTNVFSERSRIAFDGRTYQIIPETFNPNRQEDTLQFHMQLVVKDK